jgi:DNA-binding MarR family transcriptional regulator
MPDIPATPDTPANPGIPDAPGTSGTPGTPDSAELAGRLRAAIQHLLPLLRGQSVHGDLTPSRLAILAELADAGWLRISELAERVGITLSTASRMVDLLEGLGWIDRRPDPADLRATLISASCAGRAVLTDVRKEHADRLAAVIARLPAGLVHELHDALPALEALAEQSRPSPTTLNGRSFGSAP